jgi:hypothetical protein
MSEIIDALQRELSRLETELQQDPRHRRIQRIKELLADYHGEVQPTGKVHQASVAIRPRAQLRVRGRKISKAQQARQTTQHFLRARGGKAHRSELLRNLINQKIMGSEKNPMLSLASYLSNWRDILDHDGKGNWFLKEMAEREPEHQLPLSH